MTKEPKNTQEDLKAAAEGAEHEVLEDEFSEAFADEELHDKSQKVLRAIEKLLASDADIIANYEKCRVLALKEEIEDELSQHRRYKLIARRIVRHYADNSALSGGVSGLPSLIPGIGSLVGFLGATVADVVLILKFEIEMTLCLCHLAGFDISNERDRRLAFSLACVSSYEVRSSNSPVLDKLSLAGAAFWDYSLRQLSKYMLSMIGKLIILSSAKRFMRALPLVGVFVGASVNKVMTTRTGNYASSALWQRRPTNKAKHAQKSGEVYEAKFNDSSKELDAPKEAKDVKDVDHD